MSIEFVVEKAIPTYTGIGSFIRDLKTSAWLDRMIDNRVRSRGLLGANARFLAEQQLSRSRHFQVARRSIQHQGVHFFPRWLKGFLPDFIPAAPYIV